MDEVLLGDVFIINNSRFILLHCLGFLIIYSLKFVIKNWWRNLSMLISVRLIFGFLWCILVTLAQMSYILSYVDLYWTKTEFDGKFGNHESLNFISAGKPIVLWPKLMTWKRGFWLEWFQKWWTGEGRCNFAQKTLANPNNFPAKVKKGN